MEAQQEKDSIAGYENRRAAPRVRTLRRAKIVLKGGYSVFDCVIRNISDTGAMIEVSGQLGIPSHFELRMRSAHAQHPCTVRWRAERALGVSFDDTVSAAA